MTTALTRASAIPSQMTRLTDAQLQVLADAVAEEQARRQGQVPIRWAELLEGGSETPDQATLDPLDGIDLEL